MKSRVLMGVLGASMAILPAFAKEKPARQRTNRGADAGVQRAIAFERHKEAAAAREWRKEGKRDATWQNSNQAAREEEGADRGAPERSIGDPGELKQNSHGSRGTTSRPR